MSKAIVNKSCLLCAVLQVVLFGVSEASDPQSPNKGTVPIGPQQNRAADPMAKAYAAAISRANALDPYRMKDLNLPSLRLLEGFGEGGSSPRASAH